MNPELTKNFKAEAAIAAFRIIKLGAADDQVLQAAAATDSMVGVSTAIASVINERCDVVLTGMPYVEFGGTVTRGGPVTADANGKAVAAAPGAGTNNRIIGHAMVSAVVGDIGPVLLAQSTIQG